MRPYILLTVFLLAPVHAAMADLSWYLGAGGSLTGLQTRDFAGNSSLEASLDPNQRLDSGNFKDSALGWQFFGGLMFSQYFGVSLKYADSGKAKAQWDGILTTTTDPGPPPINTETNVSFDGVMSVDGFTLYFIQTLPVTEKIEYTFEIGYSRQDVDFVWDSADIPGSLSGDDSGFVLGGILRYKFLKHFAVSGEIEYSTLDFSGLIENPLKFSLNTEYHF